MQGNNPCQDNDRNGRDAAGKLQVSECKVFRGHGQGDAGYGNMPAYGLGLAGKLVPAAGRKNTAKGRLKQSQGEDAPIDTAGVEKVEEAAA